MRNFKYARSTTAKSNKYLYHGERKVLVETEKMKISSAQESSADSWTKWIEYRVSGYH